MATDYTTYGVTFEFAEAHDTAVWKEIPAVQDGGVPPVTVVQRESLTHDSGGRRLRRAYEDLGRRAFVIEYDPDDTVHQDIHRLIRTGDVVDFRISLTNVDAASPPIIGPFQVEFQEADLPLPATEADTMVLTFQIQAISRPNFPEGSSSTST